MNPAIVMVASISSFLLNLLLDEDDFCLLLRLGEAPIGLRPLEIARLDEIKFTSFYGLALFRAIIPNHGNCEQFCAFKIYFETLDSLDFVAFSTASTAFCSIYMISTYSFCVLPDTRPFMKQLKVYFNSRLPPQ